MEEQIVAIKSLWQSNDYFDERLPLLISKIYPKLRKGRTHKQIGEVLGIPHWYIIKYGLYGTNHLLASSKIEIRKRDGNKCRNCGLAEQGNPTGILHVHHIQSSRNNHASNLITVCNFCHQSLHKLKRDNKEKYKELINKIKA